MSHYYEIGTGTPVYEVDRTDGKGKRPTNSRDARKLNLVPSVTTITSVLAKPGLVNWQAEQTIYATLASARQREGEEYLDYTKRIIYESNNISRKASDRGSQLHNLLEEFYKLDSFHTEYLTDILDKDCAFITPVISAVGAVIDNITGGVYEIIPEKSFASSLGFGGKVDLVVEGKDKDNSVIIDFKTKNTIDIKKFYKYDEHLMQLAAYRTGLEMPKARCIDIYFSAIEPGIIEVHEWTEEDLQRGWKMFESLLNYWKLSNKFI
jgi:hypothetical protein